MFTVTLSAGIIFAIGVVAGIIIGAVGLAVVAYAFGKKKK